MKPKENHHFGVPMFWHIHVVFRGKGVCRMGGRGGGGYVLISAQSSFRELDLLSTVAKFVGQRSGAKAVPVSPTAAAAFHHWKEAGCRVDQHPMSPFPAICLKGEEATFHFWVSSKLEPDAHGLNPWSVPYRLVASQALRESLDPFPPGQRPPFPTRTQLR